MNWSVVSALSSCVGYSGGNMEGIGGLVSLSEF